MVATLQTPQRSSWALRAQSGNGVENEFPGPSGPRAQKVKNGVEKESKKWKFQLFFNFFDSFSTPFLTFWTPGPEGPGNSFSTPFPTLGPKGPRTPLGGLKGRNAMGSPRTRERIELAH